MTGEKRCYRCQEWKPLDLFSARNGHPSGVQGWCKACQSEHGKSPEIARRKARQNVVARVGADLDALLLESDGRCACCGDQFHNHSKEPHVEHCHATGRIRGLCCSGCNRALGGVRDSPEIALMVADYLIRHAPTGSFLQAFTSDAQTTNHGKATPNCQPSTMWQRTAPSFAA